MFVNIAVSHMKKLRNFPQKGKYVPSPFFPYLHILYIRVKPIVFSILSIYLSVCHNIYHCKVKDPAHSRSDIKIAKNTECIQTNYKHNKPC